MITVEPLIGIKELSKELNMNHYTIYKKIRENKFPKGVKINGRRKFTTTQIVEYFKNIGVEVEFSEK